MKATVLSPAFFIWSITALTMRSVGCGMATTQDPSGPARPIGVSAISGTWLSCATAPIAIDDGTPAEPIRRSTLSSSISLRALRAAVAGSEASSSTISCTLRPAISGL